MTLMETPSAFCWTKMGGEAGEPLEFILRRKEFERRLGGGLFFWGIGNALGDRVTALVARERTPKVYFSAIKSKPKTIDVAPGKVFLWTAYRDRSGKSRPMPEHVFLTSRGETGSATKRKHYALVCDKETEIRDENLGYLNFEEIRNLGSSTDKVGFSQVTAVVERKRTVASGREKLYRLVFAAELTTPHYVTLEEPIELKDQLIAEQKELGQVNHISLTDWREWLRRVQRSVRRRTIGQIQQMDLLV